MNLIHSLKTITAGRLGVVASPLPSMRYPWCVVYVLRMRLATVVYRKIALADKLLDSAAIRYGDKAGYLIVL